jgi:hypothetical protein
MKIFLAVFGLTAITVGATIQFGPLALMAIGVLAILEAKAIK